MPASEDDSDEIARVLFQAHKDHSLDAVKGIVHALSRFLIALIKKFAHALRVRLQEADAEDLKHKAWLRILDYLKRPNPADRRKHKRPKRWRNVQHVVPFIVRTCEGLVLDQRRKLTLDRKRFNPLPNQLVDPTAPVSADEQNDTDVRLRRCEADCRKRWGDEQTNIYFFHKANREVPIDQLASHFGRREGTIKRIILRVGRWVRRNRTKWGF